MKTDANGDEEWSIESGGNKWDEARDIVKLSDGSYIVTGKISLSSTNINMRVMRVSSSGDIIWQNNHGNNNYDTATSMTLSQNEDIVALVGYTRSSSGSPFKYRIYGVLMLLQVKFSGVGYMAGTRMMNLLESLKLMMEGSI